MAQDKRELFPDPGRACSESSKAVSIRELSINRLHVPQLDGSKLGEEGSAPLVVR